MSGPITPGGGTLVHLLLRWPVITSLALVSIPLLPRTVDPPVQEFRVPDEPTSAGIPPPRAEPVVPPPRVEPPPKKPPPTPLKKTKKLGG